MVKHSWENQTASVLLKALGCPFSIYEHEQISLKVKKQLMCLYAYLPKGMF